MALSSTVKVFGHEQLSAPGSVVASGDLFDTHYPSDAALRSSAAFRTRRSSPGATG